MPDESTRTVLVSLGAGLGVSLAKVGAAVLTGSSAMAAEAAHSLADNANDLSLYLAQRRSSRPPDDRHPLGYGREAYFWALIAALGVLAAAAAFSLRDGIDELIHPSATQSFAVAYAVLAISTVLDLVSFRQSAGQLIRRARRYHREFLEESRVTSEPSLRAVFLEDMVWGSEMRFGVSCGQLGSYVVLMGKSAEDLFPVDRVLGEVDRLGRAGRCLSRGQLAEGAVRPGRVVVRQVLGQHPAQVLLIDDQQPVEDFLRRVPMTRSQIAFARGACGGLATILVPSAVNTASKEPANWPARSLIRNLTAAARWPRSVRRLRAACVVHAPSGCAVMPAR